MKKLLLLIVGFVVAFAAKADDWSGKYVSFQTGTDATTEKTPNQVVSGNYGLCEWKNIVIGTDGFTIKCWDGSKNHWYGGKTITTGTYVYLDDVTTSKTKAYVNGATSTKKYNVTFYLDKKSIEIEEIEDGPLYLVGDDFGWVFDTNHQLTSTDGVIYTRDNVSFTKGKNFLICGINYSPKYSGNQNVTFGENSLTINDGKDNIAASDLTNVSISFNRDNKKLTITSKTPVAALYLHVKNDIRRHGLGKDYAPWVWLYKKGTADNIKYEEDLTHRQMVKVDGDVKGGGNEKYSLWKCDLTEEDLANYNACAFYFRNSSNNGDKVYRSATYNNTKKAVVDYDYENGMWYNYIYATATNTADDGTVNGDFAVQTYLSYDKFKELDQKDKDNGGRRNVYLVGGVKYGEWAPTETNNDNIIEKGTLSDDPAMGTMFTHPDSDQGCFYIPLKKDGSNRWFKITWLDVSECQEGQKANRDRNWATFDLGLVGVMGYDNNNIKVDTGASHDLGQNDHQSIYFENEAPNGALYFKENQSVAYRNYNQANWVLPNNDKWYWLVLDSHDECRTATICTFNPQPTVEANVSTIETEHVSFETAKSIRDTPLYASNNGAIYMTELNKASGSATITKAPGSVVGTAGYSVEYTVNLNGREIKLKNPGTIKMDYVPLAVDDRGVSIRAKYVNDGGDNPTGLSFHSRTSTSTMKLPEIKLTAPTSVTLTGRYIYQGINEETGKQVYGVYVDGFNSESEPVLINGTTTPLNVYSDFRFNEGKGWFVHKGLDWYDTYGKLVEDVKTWDCWTPNEDGYVNWSKSLMDVKHPAPLFIKDVVEVDSFDEIKALSPKTITGKVYAVYPFLYNPNASYEVTASNVPRRAARDYTGFVVANTYMPANINVSVSADNAVSGIETVEADADNAPVEYYTIAGVRVVGEPAPGLYIRRQGEKVSKVVVR